jgi:hypothetical protein
VRPIYLPILKVVQSLPIYAAGSLGHLKEDRCNFAVTLELGALDNRLADVLAEGACPYYVIRDRLHAADKSEIAGDGRLTGLQYQALLFNLRSPLLVVRE